MRAGLLALVVLPLAATAAFAATLDVGATRLTTWSAASTVPPSSCSLAATEDAYVDSVLLLSNFGAATELRVRSSTLAGNGRTFVAFDVASCVPSGARVTGTSLRLHLSTAPTADRTYDVHRVTGSWTESGVIWGGPAVAGAATASVSTGTTSGVTLSWDVTADVQAFVAGTASNGGWRVADRTEGSLTTRESVFPSREAASNRPTLAITYYP